MAGRAFAGHAMRKGVIARLEGVSPQIVELRQEIERVARSDGKILITGETCRMTAFISGPLSSNAT